MHAVEWHADFRAQIRAMVKAALYNNFEIYWNTQFCKCNSADTLFIWITIIIYTHSCSRISKSKKITWAVQKIFNTA